MNERDKYWQEQLVKLEAAKSTAQKEGKEDFDVKKFVELRYDNSKTVLEYLQENPRRIVKLEMKYYLRHPEFETLAEFVNNEISEAGYA